jgi:hypothetical protein
VAALAFSPDGRTLATGSFDTTAVLWDLTGRARGGRLPVVVLSPSRLETDWQDLTTGDGARAYRALWALAASPGQALPLLQKPLQPAAIDGPRIARLIADLDDDEFAVRERATGELAKLGASAEPALQKTLEGQASAEVRQRVERLLEKLREVGGSAEQVCQLRMLEVVEQIGSPEARQLLEKLAAGATEAALTQEAKAALRRLARRPAVTP